MRDEQTRNIDEMLEKLKYVGAVGKDKNKLRLSDAKEIGQRVLKVTKRSITSNNFMSKMKEVVRYMKRKASQLEKELADDEESESLSTESDAEQMRRTKMQMMTQMLAQESSTSTEDSITSYSNIHPDFASPMNYPTH